MSVPVVLSPSEWGSDPQCQAAQVTHWIWWWQCLAAWHCRSVWSLICHLAAEVGGLALSMAKSHWYGALRSAHKSCTCSHMSWKRGGGKRGLVAAPWTLYICIQSPLSSAWAHCISCAPTACSHCRRCCCCLLQCETAHGNLPELCRRSRPVSQITSFVFQFFLLHCFFPSQEPPDTFLKWFSNDNKVIGIEVHPPSRTHMARLQVQWWRAVGWVLSLGEHRPSLQNFTVPLTNTDMTAHWHTSPAPVAQSTPPHQVFLAPTKWPSEALDQMPSPGLQKPCRVSYWQLDTSLAAVWQQRLHLLCLCLGQSQTGNYRLSPVKYSDSDSDKLQQDKYCCRTFSYYCCRIIADFSEGKNTANYISLIIYCW